MLKLHAHSTYTSWKDTEMIKLTKDMAAPLNHLNARLICCIVVFYFSKITLWQLKNLLKDLRRTMRLKPCALRRDASRRSLIHETKSWMRFSFLSFRIKFAAEPFLRCQHITFVIVVLGMFNSPLSSASFFTNTNKVGLRKICHF